MSGGLTDQTTRLQGPVAPNSPSQLPLPKIPVLGWDDWLPTREPKLPNVGDLPYRALATSGRAALLSALHQLDLPPGSAVLVPTYHCPTMVAPIVQAGLTPVYFPIEPGGLPALDRIDETVADIRVMFAAHYFGLPLSLARVQAWCQARDIILVEDCAHTYFGMAGERPVGHWGDYATASLSKFYPVPEGGLLASAHHPLRPLNLRPQGLRAELKAAWDVVDYARRHRRLAGLRHALDALRPAHQVEATGNDTLAQPLLLTPSDQDIREGCDMGRVELRATWAARLLYRLLPDSHIVARRRDNYRRLTHGLSAAPGAQALRPHLPEQAAPYVFPLWVEGEERADAVYTRLRMAGMPVFRWDRHWPGTVQYSDDAGSAWSRHVLQLLCHQALGPADIDTSVAHVLSALADDGSRHA